MPRFTTSDGLSLHYTDEGEGLPVICLSGLTRNGSDFDYAMPALQGLRVIRPDYRGRGQSDWAEDVSTYTIPRETQDVIEMMDHLGLEKAAFVGTSRGGLIALTLAAVEPSRARMLGVCFVDIGPVIEVEGLKLILKHIGLSPVSKTHQDAAELYVNTVAGFSNVPHSRWLQEVEKHFPAIEGGLGLSYDPKLRDAVLAGFDPEAENTELWPFYDALEGLPVAAIRGANSELMSEETLNEMQRRLPGLIAANVPDRGHVPFLDEPESVRVLSEWIDRLKAVS